MILPALAPNFENLLALAIFEDSPPLEKTRISNNKIKKFTSE